MLPTDAQARKNMPIYSGVLKYFPDALAAIAECSKKGNDQHNPGKPLHWDRSKSSDEHEACVRHLMEAGKIDTDGVRHSTKAAWRALAALQKEIEYADEHDKKPTPGSVTHVNDTKDDVTDYPFAYRKAGAI